MPSITDYVYANEARKKFAAARNLPETASWKTIMDYDTAEWLKRQIRRYSLPADSTQENVHDHMDKLKAEAEDHERTLDAREYGLPDTATRKEIWEAQAKLPGTDYPVDSRGEPYTDDDDIG